MKLKSLLLSTLLALAIPVLGQDIQDKQAVWQVDIIRTTGTWVRPAGVHFAYFTAAGGGGGGGAGYPSPSGAGGAGGGGGAAESIRDLLLPTTGNIYIEIGTGGQGGQTSGANGADGTATRFLHIALRPGELGLGGASGGSYRAGGDSGGGLPGGTSSSVPGRGVEGSTVTFYCEGGGGGVGGYDGGTNFGSDGGACFSGYASEIMKGQTGGYAGNASGGGGGGGTLLGKGGNGGYYLLPDQGETPGANSGAGGGGGSEDVVGGFTAVGGNGADGVVIIKYMR